MSFSVKLDAMPEPITVEFGDVSFKLMHTYLTASERASAVYALAESGFQGAGDILWDKIVAWDGVTDENGAPLPIEKADRDGALRKSNLQVVLGRIPWINQIVTILKQFALNGVALAKVNDALQAFVSDKDELARIEAMMSDFLKGQSGQHGSKLPA